jgi:hypothetical protein
MTLLKKPLLIALAIAVFVSPLLPSVFADSGAWKNTMAEAAWEYDRYRVQRLNLGDMNGPYQFAGVTFMTTASDQCQYEESCDLVDLTIFDNGEQFTIEGVADSVTRNFWHTAQDGRFIFRVPNQDNTDWGTIYEYDPEAGVVSELMTIERQKNDLNFMTFATDANRIYVGLLHSDNDSGQIEASLDVYDLSSGYERDDFTYTLTAPWQEILDVQDGVALVKFQFSGGFEQLWLIDQTARQMEEIPETWTEAPGEIIAGYFDSEGNIHYFRNYRLFTYTPGDELPVDAGGAYLNWNIESDEAVQVAGDYMAYIDDEHGLYVVDTNGVHKFGVAVEGAFSLTEETLSFQNTDGAYMTYTLSTGAWETRDYRVTDAYEDIFVGMDANGNVWYENLTNGYLLNIGFGAEPTLTDREHAYWQGTDGNVYEVTFSPLLDLERADVEAFSSYDSNGIYLVSDEGMWLIPDEQVYFSWFNSWDDTLKVSQATIDTYLASYDYKGELKFAPGTRVKTSTSTRVYVVGSDYKLHWITSETVANNIYGSDWNQGIVEVNDTYLWKYGTGHNIDSTGDVRSI